MKMIVGLGNPGKEYENTRHNVGFMIIDHYVNQDGWKKKFDGLYQIVPIGLEKVLFLKPLTFMNLSGNSVKKAASFYQINPKDILIIQDDIDLPFGTIRLKKNSSAGGHNGIKSIINSLGTDSFCRLKIGVLNETKKDAIDFVLGKFSKNELSFLNEQHIIYEDIITTFVNEGIEKAMSKFN